MTRNESAPLKVIEVTKGLVESISRGFETKIHPGRDSSSKINFNPYLSPLALSFSSFHPPLFLSLSLSLLSDWSNSGVYNARSENRAALEYWKQKADVSIRSLIS